jgi:hypothetical protein
MNPRPIQGARKIVLQRITRLLQSQAKFCFVAIGGVSGTSYLSVFADIQGRDHEPCRVLSEACSAPALNPVDVSVVIRGASVDTDWAVPEFEVC